MGLTLAKCPSCGAELNLETDRDYFYCPHCGSKVLRQEERIVVEHVIRTVDEAKVKREEIRQAKIEANVEKKRIEAERQKNATKLILPLIFLYALVFAGVFKAPAIVYIGIVAVAGFVAYKYFSGNGNSGNQGSM